MNIDPFLPYIFTLNIFLTIIDAAVGYHAAPMLIKITASDEEASAQMTKSIRSMLAVVVGFYSFFSCLAYYQQKPLLLVIITAIIIVDIVAQILISRRMKSGREDSKQQ